LSVKEIRPDHVAIYIRWSTDDQSEGTTLAVQTEACQHYVVSQGWRVREDLVFIDDGHSGGSLDRPAMAKLRRAVQAGEIDCVVVFKLDRLSRSVIDTVTLVLQEWEDLTHLKSAREPVDTTSAMGKQFFYMLVSYAEWERNVIRERMFSGKMRRAKEGRSPGFPMAFGYKKGPTPGTLLIDEAEVGVVKLVYDLAEKGHTVRAITKYLNDHGFISRKGAPWGTSMVSKMLHNPVYTGKLVWGRRRLNPRWKKTPGEARVKTADPYVDMETPSIPMMIPQDQFDRVQRLMEGNKKIEPGALGSEHLLTGLLKCGKCGRALQYNASGRWTYYRCGFKSSQGLCDAPSLPAEALECEVIDALRQRFEQMAGALVAENKDGQGNTESLTATVSAVEQKINRLDQQERRINQDYREERLTAEERRSLLAGIQDERSRLLRTLADLRAEEAAMQDSQRFFAEQLETVRQEDQFRSLPVEKQKQILRFFIHQVRAERGAEGETAVTISWKGSA
jgi:site-specific DNA recombinase